jgi:hypothetical protein
MNKLNFKQCPGCRVWFSADEIIESPNIEPVGMVLEGDETPMNLYYFNHLCPTCQTTFTIPVDDFKPFIKSDQDCVVVAGSQKCEKHCFELEDCSPCRQKCFYAPYRKFLKEMMKTRGMLVTQKHLQIRAMNTS